MQRPIDGVRDDLGGRCEEELRGGLREGMRAMHRKGPRGEGHAITEGRKEVIRHEVWVVAKTVGCVLKRVRVAEDGVLVGGDAVA